MDATPRQIRSMQNLYAEARKRFRRHLRKELEPLLLSAGFTRVATTRCARIASSRIDIVEEQQSTSGGKCCINLGLHFPFIPMDYCGSLLEDPTSLRTGHCNFSARLAEQGACDRWWELGKSEDEAARAAAEIRGLFQHRWLGLFEKFSHGVEHFESVKIRDDQLLGFDTSPWGRSSLLPPVLFMAFVMRHLGKNDRCREFAELGLRLRERGELLPKSTLESLRNFR
jgi:hypothetical protein